MTIISTSPVVLQTLFFGYPVGDVVGACAFAAAVIAAYFTARSAIISSQALTLSTLPVLRIEARKDKGTESWFFDDELVLRNIGRGPAYSIEIEDCVMRVGEVMGLPVNNLWKLKFDTSFDLLAENDEIKLKFVAFEDRKQVDDPSVHLNLLVQSHPITVAILCRDMLGHRYITKVAIGEGHARIVMPSRRYTLRRRVAYIWRQVFVENILRARAYVWRWRARRKQQMNSRGKS